MNKKQLIALADAIRAHNGFAARGFNKQEFTSDQLAVLADFCAAQNPAFKRDRWMDYIAGKVGANGGAIKTGGNAR